MKTIKITRLGTTGKPLDEIEINPDHIISVEKDNTTYMGFAGNVPEYDRITLINGKQIDTRDNWKDKI